MENVQIVNKLFVFENAISGVNMHAIRSDIYYEVHLKIADVPVYMTSYWICKLTGSTSFLAKEILIFIKNVKKYSSYCKNNSADIKHLLIRNI